MALVSKDEIFMGEIDGSTRALIVTRVHNKSHLSEMLVIYRSRGSINLLKYLLYFFCSRILKT